MFLAPVIPASLAGLKEPPKRLLIAKWGRNESTKGGFTVGAKTKRLLPAVQAALGFDTIALDFEHNTVPGTPAYEQEKEPRNVAAHSALSVVEGEGIYVENPQWTPHGIKSITEGLHPDLSPTIKTDEAGEVVFVHSAALCRQGAATDLKIFSTADLLSAAQLRAFSATIAADSPASAEPAAGKPSLPHSLNPSLPQPMDPKALLLTLLGLAETATDAEIETAAKAAAEKLKGTAAPEKDEATAATVETHSVTIKQQGEVIAALTKRLDASDRQDLLGAAILAGKLIPNGVDKLDNAALKVVLDGLEANVVPLAQRTPEKLKTFSVAAQLTAETGADDNVRKALGISKEAWAKHAA